MNQLIETLDLYFNKKAPQIPQGGKDFIVKVAPYLTIISILFMIPALLIIAGLNAMMPYQYAQYNGFGIWAVFTIVITVLYVMALPGLFKPSPKGWNYTFYAVLVSALQNLLMMNIVSLIIGLAIGFYVLFQVKSHYFGGPLMVTPAPVTPPTPPTQNPQV